MKLLATLATASGLIWLAILVTFTSGWVQPSWRLIVATLIYLLVAALVLGTGSPSALPRRLLLLWLGALVTVYAALAREGLDPVVFGAALLYGTIAFAIWLSIPLVIYSFTAWRPTSAQSAENIDSAPTSK